MSAVVVVVGPFPPPLHGAASVTLQVRDALRDVARVLTVDTAVRGRRVAYHFLRLGRHLVAVRALCRAATAHPRTTYFTVPGGHAVWYLVWLALVARVLRYRQIFHHHSFAYLDRRSIGMTILVRLGGVRSLHVSLCPQMALNLAASYPRIGRVTICSNAEWFPITDKPVIRARRSPGPRLELGYLGNITFEKGIDTALEFYRRAQDEGHDLRLTIAGPTMSSAVQRVLERAIREDPGHIRWVGAVDSSARDRFLSQIDLLVFPSRYVQEAEPLVVLEALRAGIPVLATGRGCIEQQIRGAGMVSEGSDDYVNRSLEYLRSFVGDSGFRAAQRRLALEAGRLRPAPDDGGRRAILGEVSSP